MRNIRCANEWEYMQNRCIRTSLPNSHIKPLNRQSVDNNKTMYKALPNTLSSLLQSSPPLPPLPPSHPLQHQRHQLHSRSEVDFSPYGKHNDKTNDIALSYSQPVRDEAWGSYEKDKEQINDLASLEDKQLKVENYEEKDKEQMKDLISPEEKQLTIEDKKEKYKIENDNLNTSMQNKNKIENTVQIKKKDGMSNNDSLMCIICCDHQREVALLPCGHFYLCNECAKKITECGICREKIVEIKKIFIV